MGVVELSVKQSRAWRYLEDNVTAELLYGGAAGGGKSVLGCLWHIHRRTKYAGSRGLIGRSKLSVLEGSTLVTLFKVASDLGYMAGRDFKYNQQKNIIVWKNGSISVFKDLFQYPSDPDFNSLGSTEYTDVFIDEIIEITQKAFDILKSRIRWKLGEFGLIPKILGTCNPGPGWVKERFIIKDNLPVILHPYQKFVKSLLTDNPDPVFKELYHTQLSQMASDYDKQRLIEGDWEAEREVTRPFMNQYKQEKHESRQAIFNPNLPLLISIDFNINPFAITFAHLWKDDKGEHFHIFDEIELKHGSMPVMIETIKSRYKNKLMSCMVTGDASGNKGEISQRDNASNYLQLMRGLNLSPKQLQVPKSNPLHENSMADCNYLLFNFPDFKINPLTCPNTCRDMRIVQVDIYGKIIKKNRLDIAQQGDFFDTVRYSINTFLKQWIEFHQKQRK